MRFKDAFNPTDDELRRWARQGDEGQPVQDFDLMVAAPHRLDLLLELVADPLCRKPSFFLSCLYLLVGDAVRSSFQTIKREVVAELIERCETSTSPPLQQLAMRARDLLKEPNLFDYQDWCGGRLARQSDLP